MASKQENLRKFNTILTSILDLAEDQIFDALTPEEVESWDSFNGLIIASELESTFSLSFTTEEVTGVKNIGDMKAVLRGHQIDI